MKTNLKPGESVLVTLKGYMIRKGIFIRYVKRQAWPPVDDKERCLVQFRHLKTPTIVPTNTVKRDK